MIGATLLVVATLPVAAGDPLPVVGPPPSALHAGPPPLPQGPPAARTDRLLPNPAENLPLQAACPGVEVQPFQRQPKATPVGPCQSDKGSAARWSKDTWYKEFHAAARFPLPRFDQRRQPAEHTDGLVIYEGMRLTVDPESGTYDVSLTATVPGAPTTVHLQLIFQPTGPAKIDSDPLLPMTPAYRLTLPPIRLEPDANARHNDPTAFTFHVNHRGYSSLFVSSPPVLFGLVRCPPVIGSGWEVRRVGTARFGTPVAVDEPFR